MKKALLIAEKSSLMTTIKDVFYKHKNEFDFDITFLCQSGHLLTLKLPHELDESQKIWSWDNIPFHPNEINGWKYKVIPGQENRFNRIKEELQNGTYDFVIHAGDSDQEGELLVNLVLNYIGTDLPIYRFWTNSLTDKDVLKALHNMEDDRNTTKLINLYHSAIARQHIDYLIGMNMSEAVSLKMNSNIPVGRVKTVICKIVYQRELEILNFKPHTDFELECTYDENFKGVLAEKNEKEITPIRFENRQLAGEFTKQLGEKATVTHVDKKIVKTNAPQLYNLSALQTDASSKYGYTGDQTLSYVQSLYEKKYLSYPRTSCPFLSSNMDLENMLKSVSSLPFLTDFVYSIKKEDIQAVKNNENYINDAIVQEQSHYALSPTDMKPDLTTLTTPEKNILEMVYRRFLAIFLPPIIQEKVVVITENNNQLFYTTGKKLIDKGYTVVLNKNFEDNIIPDLKEGDIVHVKGYSAVEKTTVCPKRYTDGALIKVLEKPAKFLFNKDYSKLGKSLHIGTDATRSALIKQLIERDSLLEYQSGKGKAAFIHPTTKCMQIMEQLGDRDICRVDLSGNLEEHLEKIRTGKLDFKEFEDSTYAIVKDMVSDIKTSDMHPIIKTNTVGPCPKCNGSILVGKNGYYCSNWKEGCQSKLFLHCMNAKISLNDMKKLLNGQIIEKQVSWTDKNTGQEKKWKQKIKLNIETLSYEFIKNSIEEKESQILCPQCQTNMTLNKYKIFCKNCEYSLNICLCGVTLNEKQIAELLVNEITSEKINGFVSKKTGKKFSAMLYFDKENNCFKFKF